VEWDSIAREYVSDFELTFTVGGPALVRLVKESGDPEASIIQTFLTLLCHNPDSLIARKCGRHEAEKVSRQAGEILAVGGAFTQQGRRQLARLDRALRTRGNRSNPGTTADLTAAAIYAVMLEEGIEFMLRGGKGIPERRR
jgi:triphosphoribosyl-dephospho-CoA synthase